MNQTAQSGNISFFGLLLFGTISWLTPENIDLALKIFTGIGALISAGLASRYYYYATKEKKELLKRNKDVTK